MNNYKKIREILDSLNTDQKQIYSVSVAQLLSPILNELADDNTKKLFIDALRSAWKILLGNVFKNNSLLVTLTKRVNLYVIEEIDQDDFIGDDKEWDVSRIVGILIHFFELYFGVKTSIEISSIPSLSLELFQEIDYHINNNSEKEYNLEEKEYRTELRILEIIRSTQKISNSLIEQLFELVAKSNQELVLMMPLIIQKTERWMEFEN